MADSDPKHTRTSVADGRVDIDEQIAHGGAHIAFDANHARGDNGEGAGHGLMISWWVERMRQGRRRGRERRKVKRKDEGKISA